MSIIIRKARLADIGGITEIYNEAILTTDATFDTQPKSIKEQRQWYRAHGSRNPILVAADDGKITGWASLSQWSSRCAYADTAEVSLYVRQEYRRKSIGKALLQNILKEGQKYGLHTILSRITGGNKISIELHQKYGFQHIGVMKEVGHKNGKLLDVVMMQLIF